MSAIQNRINVKYDEWVQRYSLIPNVLVLGTSSFSELRTVCEEVLRHGRGIHAYIGHPWVYMGMEITVFPRSTADRISVGRVE